MLNANGQDTPATNVYFFSRIPIYAFKESIETLTITNFSAAGAVSSVTEYPMLDGSRLIGLEPSHRIRFPYSVITIRFSLTGNVGGNGAHGKWRFSFIDAFNLSPYSFLVLFFGLKIRTSPSLLEAVGVVAAVVAGAHVNLPPVQLS